MRAADPNTTPLRFRKLRIAFSAVCGIICLLLIALWVRSHWRFDCIYSLYKNRMSHGMSLTLASNAGIILIPIRPARETDLFLYDHKGWKLRSREADPETFNVQWMPAPDKPWVVIPHWLPVVLCSTLAAAPWIQRFRRFSLRTLLIAMTLAAVILGTIVIAAGK
jgi:hypothetical protein